MTCEYFRLSYSKHLDLERNEFNQAIALFFASVEFLNHNTLGNCMNRFILREGIGYDTLWNG